MRDAMNATKNLKQKMAQKNILKKLHAEKIIYKEREKKENDKRQSGN